MLKSIWSKIKYVPIVFKKPIFNRFNNFYRINTSSSSQSEPEEERGIFVSSHFVVGKEEITSFLTKFQIEHKIRPTGQIVAKYCPICPKPHYNKIDNLWTFNVKSSSGAFFCFRCGQKGSWFDLKNLFSAGEPIKISRSPGFSHQSEPPKMADETASFLFFKNLIMGVYPESLKYLLNERKLSLDTLKAYKCGLGEERFINENGEFVNVPVIYFPMFRARSKKDREKFLKGINKSENLVENLSNEFALLVRTKVRGIGSENKHFQKLKPTPGFTGIFGLHLLTPDTKEIVITEGEYDAMAVYQATGIVSLSLPNGAHHLPVEILPWIEKVTKVYLWLDADDVGRANNSKIAEKLGIQRTLIVDSRDDNPNGPKDANDALREDEKTLNKYLSKGKMVNQDNITTFSELRENILNRILRFEENQGIKFSTFVWLNRKLKGFRRGELSIFSGLTGSGKTTILSQISLDVCGKGVPTLWGSFEIKNEILMTNMILQFSGVDLVKEPQKFEYHADRFEMIPMYFMKFFGSCELDKLIATIESAIYAYDIGHVIIDNLQFLLSGQARGIERFELQDESISRFRKLATQNNVHVSIVIHPKKVEDTADLNIASVFGTAKSTQEADNVFMIQTRKKYKVLELKKNRFDGEVGACALGFHKETKRFLELKEGEVERLERERDYTFANVLEERSIRNEQVEVHFASDQFLDELKEKQAQQKNELEKFVTAKDVGEELIEDDVDMSVYFDEKKAKEERRVKSQKIAKEPITQNQNQNDKEENLDAKVPSWFLEYETVSTFYKNPEDIPSERKIESIVQMSSDMSMQKKNESKEKEKFRSADDFYLQDRKYKKNN